MATQNNPEEAQVLSNQVDNPVVAPKLLTPDADRLIDCLLAAYNWQGRYVDMGEVPAITKERAINILYRKGK
jgi:hypothetical protein